MGKCPVLPSWCPNFTVPWSPNFTVPWSPNLPSWSTNLPSWSPNFTVLESEFYVLESEYFLDLSKMSDCVNMLGLCLPTDMWFNQEEKKEKSYKN